MRYAKDRSAGWQRVMRWANVNSSMLCSASLRNTGLKGIADQVRLLLFATDPEWKVELNVHFVEVIPGRGSVDYAAYLREVSKLPVDAPLRRST
jgi:hypothetical protein